MLETENHRQGSVSAYEGFVTSDMIAQYAYCRRRFHLVYLESRWADNEYTDEGRFFHRRVDGGSEPLPPPSELIEAFGAFRSLELEAPRLLIRGRLDVAEVSSGESSHVAPVEFKRGSPPEEGGEAWDNDRLQVVFYALLLKENGYDVKEGWVFYGGVRRRIGVELTPAREEEVKRLIEAIQALLEAEQPALPSPLSESPKCVGCSLNGICLPDETNLLEGSQSEGENVRRLFPARDDRLPLYVQEQGAYVGKKGESLYVTAKGGTLAEVKLKDVSQLVLCGSVSISPALIHLLCEAGIPIVHLSYGHWFYGVTAGQGLRNAFDRDRQFARAKDTAWCLEFSKAVVMAKGANQRTLLRRNGGMGVGAALSEMAHLLSRVPKAKSQEELLGFEGAIAGLYFQNFGSLLVGKTERGAPEGKFRGVFSFSARNRRPPRDPVNAMLSFGYALLAKECFVALLGGGLDPYWGFYHRPRHGRPALALGLMEEFRATIVDSSVISAVNTGMVDETSFVLTGRGCALTPAGRKAFIRAFERRLDGLATHPVFDYRCSWRRLISLQAQLLARALREDTCSYEGLATR